MEDLSWHGLAGTGIRGYTLTGLDLPSALVLALASSAGLAGAGATGDGIGITVFFSTTTDGSRIAEFLQTADSMEGEADSIVAAGFMGEDSTAPAPNMDSLRRMANPVLTREPSAALIMAA
jgi:hypothetical protein